MLEAELMSLKTELQQRSEKDQKAKMVCAKNIYGFSPVHMHVYYVFYLTMCLWILLHIIVPL